MERSPGLTDLFGWVKQGKFLFIFTAKLSILHTDEESYRQISTLFKD